MKTDIKKLPACLGVLSIENIPPQVRKNREEDGETKVWFGRNSVLSAYIRFSSFPLPYGFRKR
jgi:hypothetical protein